jgi:hypothetical protein
VVDTALNSTLSQPVQASRPVRRAPVALRSKPTFCCGRNGLSAPKKIFKTTLDDACEDLLQHHAIERWLPYENK